MRGRFITLEGGEGVGKSTQLAALAAALRARGIEAIETREPGGSPGAEAIRALLLGGETDRWSLGAEALLFAAARADHVGRVILPALEKGTWVLCDRFIDSSLAYQAHAGGLGEEAVRRLHDVGSGGLYPDRTLLLELPTSAAADRARSRDGNEGDRIGGRDSSFHDAVAAGFDALVRAEPQRIRRIDASGSPAEVTQRLFEAIGDLL